MTSQHLMIHTQPNNKPLNKLQGEGELPSTKHEEAQKRLTMINYLTEKIKLQKEVMKEAKEAKKEKNIKNTIADMTPQNQQKDDLENAEEAVHVNDFLLNWFYLSFYKVFINYLKSEKNFI